MKRRMLALALAALLALSACGKGEDKGVAAAALSTVLVARDDVPADDIYALTAAIFGKKEDVAKLHARGGELDLEAAASAAGVPYHPGAARYFAEQGKTVPAIKDGAGAGSARPLVLATGGDGGTYHAYGGILAAHIAGASGVAVTAMASGGSQANIGELSADRAQLALVQSDVMSCAYRGERLFRNAWTGFSVVAVLYRDLVQIVTADPNVKTAADLAGKKVAVGVSGSGVYYNAADILSACGIDPRSGIDPVYQSFARSAAGLKDGTISAAFLAAPAPAGAVEALGEGVRLVSLDEGALAALASAFPCYSAVTVKDGTY